MLTVHKCSDPRLFVHLSNRMRTLIDFQRVKGSETLHKSARQYFCHIFLITLKTNQVEKLGFSTI